MIGAFTSVAMYGVGVGNFSSFGNAAGAVQFASFGAVGGITSVLSGGKFGHGFFAAGVSTALGGAKFLQGGGKEALRTIIKTVVGGTVSKLTGGKFANGAAYGAFAAILTEGAASVGQSGGGRGTPEDRVAMQTEIDQLFEDGSLSTKKIFKGVGAVDEAAKEVLGATASLSDEYGFEVGGHIVENGGGVSYTRPRIIGATGGDLSTNIGVAGYHTHHGEVGLFTTNVAPSDGGGSDAGWVFKANKPLYMGVVKSIGGRGTVYSVCETNSSSCSRSTGLRSGRTGRKF